MTKYKFFLSVLTLIIICLFNVFDVRTAFKNYDNAVFAQNNINMQIVINQVGYYKNNPKVAFLINGDINQNNVQLVNVRNQEPVFVTSVGNPYTEEDSKKVIQRIDFTEFNREGNYYLQYGNIKSYPFRIGSDVYQNPFKLLLRSYYLQRCGVAVQDRVTGVRHPACHVNDGLIAHTDTYKVQGKFITAKGGWHDAGDFGKYVGPTSIAVGRLLNLYEQYPKLFSDRQLTIPESGNRIPDILDEAKIGIDWMLTMQRLDGAVYRKLSGKNWPGFISPHEDKQPRFVYGISTSETAKFAAVMAMAARIYSPFHPRFTLICLRAAERAWSFLETQPSIKVDWVEGDDSGSGSYIDNSVDQQEALKRDRDHRLWAAAELYITTGRANFENYLAQTIPVTDYTLFQWTNPSSLGMMDYLLMTRQPYNVALLNQIQEKLITRANLALKKVENSPWRLANQQFIWGSNKLVAEEGITLMYAYRITKNQAYLHAAIDQLDYLLGRNHFNKSFVSGVGTNFVRNVHHRIAIAQKIIIPGLLVGGPNTHAQDGIAPKDMKALSYIDDERSYATNEYAIDYNASLIGLLGMLMQLSNR